MANNSPMALSVEKIRHEMLRGLLVPREMVNEALLKTYKQLNAKETRFFAFKGRVTETAEVDDHATQAAACDKIFSLAGLYAREREARDSTPGVALEVDPTTGVVRIIVGGGALPALPESQTLELPPVECSPAEQGVVIMRRDTPPAASVGRRRAAAPSLVDAAFAAISYDEVVD